MNLLCIAHLVLAGQAPVISDHNRVRFRYSWRYQWTRRTYHNFD